ncbi:hypothetical protein RIF29_40572 [Crotalaria pallida]|uniref:J domain-containing protein n=1 Tax=Crotalaria pallida TaxID=3830 RepID=A0AAN9E6D6_CROPI
MECNKEEAVRARDIAEKKMESKDFTGARKVALKAKQLYPDLENIGQMLIVCDVHCASEQKLNGNEMDWYKILQIEMTADEATIKKQYRKFALQLHPDKNKFAGAEAAFKLVGEAQRVLLDSLSRSRFDGIYRIVSMNRNAMPSYHTQKVQMQHFNVGQRNVRPNFTNLNHQQHQQQPRPPSQQGVNGVQPTFWTACSFCSFRYQYYREVLNRSLRCQHCNRPFIAYDVDMRGTTPTPAPTPTPTPTPTPAANSTQQTFGQQKYGMNHGAFKAGVGSQANLHTDKSNAGSSEKKGPAVDVYRKPNGKRKKKRGAESSESSDSISSTDSEDDMFADNDSFPGIDMRREHPRRSSRQRHQVSYKENVSDDDDVDSLRPSKKGKGIGSSVAGESCGEAAKMNHQNGLAADQKDVQKGVKRKHSEESVVNRNEEVKEESEKEVDDSETDEAPESAPYIYPDPEFYDFDKDKKEECFKVGQIWAIFDTTDGMPRFYAIVKKVYSPGFKLQITWIEPDIDDKLKKRLPIGCGKYKIGATDKAEDHLVFSHLISCEKVNRDTFKIYPRKGETWALYKNWDLKWDMDVESPKKFDYEFVEILSDYVEGEGIVVAYLAKLKNFVSLFSRVIKEGNHSFQIPSVELFRFSHRVPSFKMTGEEREGVPIGSFELDPASLPQNLEEIAVPEDAELKVGHSSSVGMSTKPVGVASTSKVNLERSNPAAETKDSVDHFNDGSAPSASSAEAFEIPDPQFFDFDKERAPEKFRVDQIWAFYSDEDGQPKYYGRVKSVRSGPDFKIKVKYLANCWLPEDTIRWEDEGMVISCGGFKIKARGDPYIYDNTHTVSHQVHPSTSKKKGYMILPSKGEFWALYKKWTPKLQRSDLENMEYDIVQVVEQTELWIDVLLQEKVSGYNSVFKGGSNKGTAKTVKIPMKELLRFSHRIPAFELTNEADGNLRGCWELDPSALPVQYFSSK